MFRQNRSKFNPRNRNKNKTYHQSAKFENLAPELLEPNKVYISNLLPAVTEKLLYDTFKQYANVTKVYLPRVHRRNSKYGFISLASEDDTQKLLQWNKTYFDRWEHISYNPLIIRPAKKRVKLPGMDGYTRICLDNEFDLELPRPDDPTIHSLFDELLFKIFDFMTPKQIICCEQVCRRWQVLVYEYFNNNFKPKIEIDISCWLLSSHISFQKTLILCGATLKTLEVNESLNQNILLTIAQLCPMLEVLKLSKTRFKQDHFEEFIKTCTEIREISINETHTFTDNHLSSIFHLPKLESIELVQLIFEGNCFEELPLNLKRFTVLDCDFNFEKMSHVPKKCPNLEMCKLDETMYIGKDTFNLLAECPKLNSLSAEFGFYSEDALKTFSSLKELDFTGSFTTLIKIVGAIPNIEDLSLDVDFFSHSDLDFSLLKNLRSLSLGMEWSDSKLTSKTSESILSCMKLEKLDLGSCTNATLILDCLRNLKILKVLKCSCFELSSSDVDRFISANKKRDHILELSVILDDDATPKLNELKKANLEIKHCLKVEFFCNSSDDENPPFWDLMDYVSDLDFEDYIDDDDDDDDDPFNFCDFDVFNDEMFPGMYLEFQDFL